MLLLNKITFLSRLKNALRLFAHEREIKKSGLFDEAYYLSHNADVAKEKISPLKHFLLFGALEGRDPSEEFNVLFYLRSYPDVMASGMNPLLHYVRHGKEEGRKINDYGSNAHLFTSRKFSTLIFDHNLGGGTWTYVYNKLINPSNISPDEAVLLARYNAVDQTYLAEVRRNSAVIEKASNKDADKFFGALSESDFSVIIVNNIVSWPSAKYVLNWIAQYKKTNPHVSVEFKGHDYYSVCPCYILQDKNHRYCGIRNDEMECDDCVHSLGKKAAFLDQDNEVKYSVTGWRRMWNNFFVNTTDVFEVFSLSAQRIFVQAYPAIVDKIKLIPHEIPSFERYHVAIIGNLAVHKGAEVIREVCRYADENHIGDVQFHLFGENFENIVSKHLSIEGPYERYELPTKLRNANIDLVFIPSTWPETFCYTAGEAISLGYPVACFDLGGQSDQVRNSDKGIILYNEDPAYLYQTFKEVCSALRLPDEAELYTKSDTPVKSVVMQDKKSRDFLKWMYEQRDDKSHFVPEAEDAIQRTDEMPRIIAFYLPQFHDFAENVKWFGRGFSEWTNTAQTLPQFIGHRQPHTPIDVGFYNLNTSQIMHRQAELAKKYGIAGFSIYYYWFSGAKLMEQPLKHLLADKNLDFPFCLFWANEHWTRLWGNGADREVLHKMELLPGDAELFMKDALPYMLDPRYIKVNNKPVLTIYKLKIFPKEDYLSFISTIQRIAREHGFDGIYLSGIIEEWMDSNDLVNIQKEYGLDALTEFSSTFGRRGWKFKHNEAVDPAFRSYQYDVVDYVQNRKYLRTTDANVFVGLFTEWDNSPRRYNRGASIMQSSPENYKQWLSDLIRWTKENHSNPEEQFIFVNAWNEWAEGAHLEPDTYYGYAFLQQTRDALEEAFLKDQNEG